MERNEVARVTIGNVGVGNTAAPVLIAGLCVIENPDHTLATARRLKTIAHDAGFDLIFKASYDKANRTSANAYRGPGLIRGLETLRAVRLETALPVLTDVHEARDVETVAASVDCIQVPAFLCRQTDLLLEVGRAGKPVNLKKGQFLAPADMAKAVEKVASTGNRQITLTERGSCFGYNNLVVDMRSLAILRGIGFPVVFDATHSVQFPGGGDGCSAGDRRFAPLLARAATAAGIDALFLETHDDPDRALCDGPNSLALDSLPELLNEIRAIASALIRT